MVVCLPGLRESSGETCMDAEGCLRACEGAARSPSHQAHSFMPTSQSCAQKNLRLVASDWQCDIWVVANSGSQFGTRRRRLTSLSINKSRRGRAVRGGRFKCRTKLLLTGAGQFSVTDCRMISRRGKATRVSFVVRFAQPCLQWCMYWYTGSRPLVDDLALR